MLKSYVLLIGMSVHIESNSNIVFKQLYVTRMTNLRRSFQFILYKPTKYRIRIRSFKISKRTSYYRK